MLKPDELAALGEAQKLILHRAEEYTDALDRTHAMTLSLLTALTASSAAETTAAVESALDELFRVVDWLTERQTHATRVGEMLDQIGANEQPPVELVFH